MANVELRGMALPEIANAESDAARRASHVPQAARATALRRVEPRVAIGGALADGERIRVGLQQCPVAERRNVLQQVVGDGRDGRCRDTVDLRLACGLARIAAQPGECAHRFGKQAILLADEPNVPIVERVGQRR